MKKIILLFFSLTLLDQPVKASSFLRNIYNDTSRIMNACDTKEITEALALSMITLDLFRENKPLSQEANDVKSVIIGTTLLFFIHSFLNDLKNGAHRSIETAEDRTQCGSHSMETHSNTIDGQMQAANKNRDMLNDNKRFARNAKVARASLWGLSVLSGSLAAGAACVTGLCIPYDPLIRSEVMLGLGVFAASHAATEILIFASSSNSYHKEPKKPPRISRAIALGLLGCYAIGAHPQLSKLQN